MQTEKANPNGVRNNPKTQLNIIDDINVKNSDICLEMGIKIKGLIFILDTFLISLEMDRYFTYHKYIQDGILNLNILLDLLLKDNTKLEKNQKHINEILKQLTIEKGEEK